MISRLIPNCLVDFYVPPPPLPKFSPRTFLVPGPAPIPLFHFPFHLNHDHLVFQRSTSLGILCPAMWCCLGQCINPMVYCQFCWFVCGCVFAFPSKFSGLPGGSVVVGPDKFHRPPPRWVGGWRGVPGPDDSRSLFLMLSNTTCSQTPMGIQYFV